MSDAKTRYPIPVITASSEDYDAMLRAEHVLIVAHDAAGGAPDIRPRRCLIRCGEADVFSVTEDALNTQKLQLMVGG